MIAQANKPEWDWITNHEDIKEINWRFTEEIHLSVISNTLKLVLITVYDPSSIWKM